MSKTGGGRGTNQHQVKGRSTAARGAGEPGAGETDVDLVCPDPVVADGDVEIRPSHMAIVAATHRNIDAAMRSVAEESMPVAIASLQHALDECHPSDKRTIETLHRALDMASTGDWDRTDIQRCVAQAGTDLPWGHSNAGAKLPTIWADQECAQCSAQLVERARFCTECGTPVAGPAPTRR